MVPEVGCRSTCLVLLYLAKGGEILPGRTWVFHPGYPFLVYVWGSTSFMVRGPVLGILPSTTSYS